MIAVICHWMRMRVLGKPVGVMACKRMPLQHSILPIGQYKAYIPSILLVRIRTVICRIITNNVLIIRESEISITYKIAQTINCKVAICSERLIKKDFLTLA